MARLWLLAAAPMASTIDDGLLELLDADDGKSADRRDAEERFEDHKMFAIDEMDEKAMMLQTNSPTAAPTAAPDARANNLTAALAAAPDNKTFIADQVAKIAKWHEEHPLNPWTMERKRLSPDALAAGRKSDQGLQLTDAELEALIE